MKHIGTIYVTRLFQEEEPRVLASSLADFNPTLRLLVASLLKNRNTEAQTRSSVERWYSRIPIENSNEASLTYQSYDILPLGKRMLYFLPFN